VKIAWVLYGALDQKTGGTIYDRMVVEGLKRGGDDVIVISIAPGASNVASMIRDSACEVVVGDELCFRELAVAFNELGRDLPRTPARRILLVHHLTGWETSAAQSALPEERAAIEACDAIITTSVTTKNRLMAEGARARIDVVVPGADRLTVVRHEARHEDSRPTRFLFLGTVMDRKRVKELVRAFEGAVEEGEGTLTIVGSTTRDERYAREVKATLRGGAERIVMTGELDDDAVARALGDADVLVMPSSLEGWGIAATEAIRAGVPVIAARAQGLAEALASCPNATLFADDEPALAAALQRFATDASLREKMTASAVAASPHMPTWAACVASFRAAILARS
jgi:glycosyltransferase involved in cell wall biosynthesis